MIFRAGLGKRGVGGAKESGARVRWRQLTGGGRRASIEKAGVQA